MFYVFGIDTPLNTPATAKVKTSLQLARGRITQIQVHFPSGQIGLTHITISRGLHQFLPTNPEANFSSSGETIPIAEDFALDTAPFALEAYTWNLDDTYAHKITVRVQLEALPVERNLIQEVRDLLGLD